MKDSYFILFLIVLSSCEPDLVEDNRRTIVEVKITDSEQEALPNINVAYGVSEREIFIQDGDQINQRFQAVLGQDISNTSGDVSFISLVAKPQFNTQLIIINAESPFFNLVENPTYEKIIYKLNDAVDGSIRLPETTLRKKATVGFSIERLSAANTTLFYDLSFKRTTTVVDFSSGERLEDDRSFGELTPTIASDSRTLQIPQGTSLLLTYSIFNGQELLEQGSEEYLINESTENFEFNF